MKKSILACAVVCACVVWGFVGNAMAYDGMELLVLCDVGLTRSASTPERPGLGSMWSAGLCEGYVEAVKDTLLAGEKTICLPRFDMRQDAEVVRQYLGSISPTPRLRVPAHTLVQQALIEAFPCTEGE